MPLFQGRDNLLPLGFLAVIVVIGVAILPVQSLDPKPDYCIYCKDMEDCKKEVTAETIRVACDIGICEEVRNGTVVIFRSCIPYSTRNVTVAQANCAFEHLRNCTPVTAAGDDNAIRKTDYKNCLDEYEQKGYVHGRAGSRADGDTTEVTTEKSTEQSTESPLDKRILGSYCYCKEKECNVNLKVNFPGNLFDKGGDGTDDDGANMTSLDKLAFLTLLLVGGGSRWWWSLNENL